MTSKCINCSSSLPESVDRCPTCGVAAADPPNVRAVRAIEEREGLNSRYERAISEAKSKGSLKVLEAFQLALRGSCAVIGSDLHVIRQLVTNDKALYNNYFSLVNANFRKPAKAEDERQRRVADAILLDGYGEKIVFAALSIDGVGLRSYGSYSITLRDVAVAKRATVLEENSFSFVEKRCTVKGEVPRGYRAVWQERDKLGVAKLADRITAGTDTSQFPRLALSNGKDRGTDDFMEVHIYGPFDGQAIETVRGPAHPKKAEERATARVVKEYLVRAGKNWVYA
jgi:hypothetical protein